jgi:hypothetical protein
LYTVVIIGLYCANKRVNPKHSTCYTPKRTLNYMIIVRTRGIMLYSTKCQYKNSLWSFLQIRK